MDHGVQQRHSDEETRTGHSGVGLGTAALRGVPAQVVVHGRGERRSARAAHHQHNSGQPQTRRRVAGVPPQQDMLEDHRHTFGIYNR